MVHTLAGSLGILSGAPTATGGVINLVVTDRERRLLVLQKGSFWILPGGKLEVGESDQLCLERELSEKLPNFRWSFEDATYWRTFLGTTPRSLREVAVRTYLLSPDGTYSEDVGACGAEISNFQWLPHAACEQASLSQITRNIANALRAERIIL